MKKIIIILTLGFSSIIWGQEISSQDWETDLNFLRSELPKKHNNLFFSLSKAEFNAVIDDIIESLDKDSDVETMIRIQSLLSKVEDSHTKIGLRKFKKKFKILPFSVRSFSDGYYITSTSKDRYSILDKKIKSVNGYEIDQIEDSLKTLFVAENNAMIRTNVEIFLNDDVYYKYFGFSNHDSQKYELELEDTKGNIERFEVPVVDNVSKNQRIYTKRKNIPFFRNGSGESFKDFYFEDDNIYFIQYNKCTSKETVQKYGDKDSAHKFPSFDEFKEKVLAKLSNEKIDKVIFDVRFNKGGSSYLAESLIDQIALDDNINQDGKLFVIIGKDTFSSAIFNAIYFKNNTNAILIGEETAGKPNHYGNIGVFTLPYSNIDIVYSKNYYTLTEENLNSLIPEIEVKETFNDYKEGIDPALEYVKNYKK